MQQRALGRTFHSPTKLHPHQLQRATLPGIPHPTHTPCKLHRAAPQPAFMAQPPPPFPHSTGYYAVLHQPEAHSPGACAGPPHFKLNCKCRDAGQRILRVPCGIATRVAQSQFQDRGHLSANPRIPQIQWKSVIGVPEGEAARSPKSHAATFLRERSHQSISNALLHRRQVTDLHHHHCTLQRVSLQRDARPVIRELYC